MKMSLFAAKAVIAVAAVTLPAISFAQELSPDEAARIDAAVTKVLTETGVPAAQVSVVRDGRIVLSRAWGKASRSQPVARADMRFQVASISKQFLGALMLMLEDEGKLSLDDKVAKWLPEVTGADRITVRQLLNHTSGLQDYWPQDFAFAAMEKPVSPRDIVERWGRKPLDYEPGTRWQYSNTGYVVAGMIAEKAGGAHLWYQFEKRIFKPLGIDPVPIDSTTGPAFPEGHNRFALGPVRPATPPARGWLWAAGELAMSAQDLAKWNIARIERKLLPPEDWEEMERPAILKGGTTSNYGLGVFKVTSGGRTLIDHGGASVGFLSLNRVWPDARAAVSVLTNGDFGGAQDKISDAVAEIVLPRGPQASLAETPRTEDARSVLAGLAKGTIDPARFTENARYYFTPATLADYRETLARLGEPTAIEPLRSPRLRGGFVNRVFKVSWPGRSLYLSTYAEAGDQGCWEQFMLTE
ncbi:serine hydrolase [Novosphingobium sp. TH158]|uniref:serine hydrolase domain-containing protein n=1 Tax=Novosphingobium sp. TH158 TaxID=2067455 RepID=UPI000C7BEF6C|nr:serine hydrolase domain-containing protein [Novosphingobium sp. TH158]PLK24341.1 serine hydrolase [Novosphingobium sp. TH158]